MWGKKKKSKSNETIDSLRKQIKADETATEFLFQLKSEMHQVDPTYSWKCDDCSTSQKSPVFPSNDDMTEFYQALQSAAWGEVVDSVRADSCKKCRSTITTCLTLCEGCYEDYVAFIFTSGKGGGGGVKHIGSMKLGKCENCGYRPQGKKRQDSKRLKRYDEMLEYFPEVKKMIESLTSSGLIRE